MKYRALIAAFLASMPPLAAHAEDGCDGGCPDGWRGRGGYHRDYRDRDWHNGHANYYQPHRRSRTVITFNYGEPYYPYYYRPARVVYAPVPVAMQPDVVYINDSNSRRVQNDDGRYCREYQSRVRVGGQIQQSYGTACMQPDGSWEIIS